MRRVWLAVWGRRGAPDNTHKQTMKNTASLHHEQDCERVRYDVSDRHVWSVIQSTLLFEYECRLIFNNAACNYHIKQVECLYTNLMLCILQLSLVRFILTNTYSKKGENKVIFGLLHWEFPFITSMNYKIVIGSEPLRIITNLIAIKSSLHKLGIPFTSW